MYYSYPRLCIHRFRYPFLKPEKPKLFVFITTVLKRYRLVLENQTFIDTSIGDKIMVNLF